MTIAEFDAIQNGVLQKAWGPIIGTPNDDVGVDDTNSASAVPGLQEVEVVTLNAPATVLPNVYPAWRRIFTVGPVYSTDIYQGTVALTAVNQVEQVTPFWMPNTVTVDEMLANVQGAFAAGNDWLIRLGIYADVGESGHYPGALVLDAGTVAPGTTAGFKAISVNKQLTPGLYWFVVKTTGTTGTPGSLLALPSNSATAALTILGHNESTGSGNPVAFTGFRRTGIAAGAFADPYPSAQSLVTSPALAMAFIRLSAVTS